MCRILRWAQVRHHDEAEVLTLAPGAIFQDRGFHQLSIESPCVRARIWSGHLGSGFRSGADEQIALHTHDLRCGAFEVSAKSWHLPSRIVMVQSWSGSAGPALGMQRWCAKAGSRFAPCIVACYLWPRFDRAAPSSSASTSLRPRRPPPPPRPAACSLHASGSLADACVASSGHALAEGAVKLSEGRSMTV